MAIIQIIGNLGRDPETRYTPEGRQVTSFTVAVNRVSTQGGERREETDWYRVSAWGANAKFAEQYLQKGRRVYVSGRFAPRTFIGQDGQSRLSLDITADHIIPVDAAPRADVNELPAVGASLPGRAKPSQPETFGEELNDEELNEEAIPF
ncbi:MAG: single-stranded DNA-binding protein [Chloroflexota bacterium]|nr:single-stranded DNA-binding protein [Dehalococcoidia bacterium]MDW8253619.1 single-stranded DNA-binding protein [Chloroflexota bacterium]